MIQILPRDPSHVWKVDDSPTRFSFNDKVTFHINGKIYCHNVCVWGTENPHVTLEHKRDSAKVNVFCTISKEKFYGPFFFKENTVMGNFYLDMDSNDFIFHSWTSTYLIQWCYPHISNAINENAINIVIFFTSS